LPAERERERGRKIEIARERASERASQLDTHEFRSDSDSSVATNSRSVKRRDDGGGDPARHDRARTNGWQSRPSGGRDKDERCDPFRRMKWSVVRSARKSCEGTDRKKGNDQRIFQGSAVSRSKNLVLHLVLRIPIVPIFRRPKELEKI